MPYRYPLAALFLLAAACHLLHAPESRAPQLSAGVHQGVLRSGGLDRSYLLYVPERRLTKPPLVVLLHGSRQTARDMRMVTGYAFDRLADEEGFVAVYPEGYARRWNDCRARGRYRARKLKLDDVDFLLTSGR